MELDQANDTIAFCKYVSVVTRQNHYQGLVETIVNKSSIDSC